MEIRRTAPGRNGSRQAVYATLTDAEPRSTAAPAPDPADAAPAGLPLGGAVGTPGSTSAFLDDAPPDAPPPVPPAPPDPAWQTLIDAISAAGRLAAHLKAGNARCKLIEALNEARRAALKHTTRHLAAPGLTTVRSALEYVRTIGPGKFDRQQNPRYVRSARQQNPRSDPQEGGATGTALDGAGPTRNVTPPEADPSPIARTPTPPQAPQASRSVSR